MRCTLYSYSLYRCISYHCTDTTRIVAFTAVTADTRPSSASISPFHTSKISFENLFRESSHVTAPACTLHVAPYQKSSFERDFCKTEPVMYSERVSKVVFERQEAFEKCRAHCATASRFTLPFTKCRYCRTQHCRTPPAHRCLQRRRRQRQRVTEGTAMAPWNGPKNFPVCERSLIYSWTGAAVSGLLCIEQPASSPVHVD